MSLVRALSWHCLLLSSCVRVCLEASWVVVWRRAGGAATCTGGALVVGAAESKHGCSRHAVHVQQVRLPWCAEPSHLQSAAPQRA